MLLKEGVHLLGEFTPIKGFALRLGDEAKRLGVVRRAEDFAGRYTCLVHEGVKEPLELGAVFVLAVDLPSFFKGARRGGDRVAVSRS